MAKGRKPGKYQPRVFRLYRRNATPEARAEIEDLKGKLVIIDEEPDPNMVAIWRTEEFERSYGNREE
jgi:hypothetical protein